MTITLSSISGGKRTLTMTRQVDAAKMDTTFTEAAECLFNRGLGDHGTIEKPRTFANQTTAEKLLVVENYIQRVILNLAAQGYREKSVAAAQKTAAEFIAANQDL